MFNVKVRSEFIVYKRILIENDRDLIRIHVGQGQSPIGVKTLINTIRHARAKRTILYLLR